MERGNGACVAAFSAQGEKRFKDVMELQQEMEVDILERLLGLSLCGCIGDGCWDLVISF